MEAAQGDRIIVRGRTVGSTDRHGVILEVKGQEGHPPYLVRFDDGHETVMYPGGDFAVDKTHGGLRPSYIAGRRQWHLSDWSHGSFRDRNAPGAGSSRQPAQNPYLQHPPARTGPRDPGDAWVEGDSGRFWGRFGAAGVLAYDPDRGVLLQHRARVEPQRRNLGASRRGPAPGGGRSGRRAAGGP